MSMHTGLSPHQVTVMRSIRTLSLFVCLGILGLAGEAAAIEAQHTAAPEAVETPDAASAQGDRGFDGDVDGAVAASHAQRTSKPAARATTTTTQRSGSDGRSLPSRFHSFLPGMFR